MGSTTVEINSFAISSSATVDLEYELQMATDTAIQGIIAINNSSDVSNPTAVDETEAHVTSELLTTQLAHQETENQNKIRTRLLACLH